MTMKATYYPRAAHLQRNKLILGFLWHSHNSNTNSQPTPLQNTCQVTSRLGVNSSSIGSFLPELSILCLNSSVKALLDIEWNFFCQQLPPTGLVLVLPFGHIQNKSDSFTGKSLNYWIQFSHPTCLQLNLFQLLQSFLTWQFPGLSTTALLQTSPVHLLSPLEIAMLRKENNIFG